MTQILENVDPSKREKFNEKYQKLKEENWNRDNFVNRLREVEQAISNIEDFITGIQEDINAITGEGRDESAYDRIEEDFGEDRLNRLESKDLGGGHSPTLKKFDEKSRELADLRKRENEWKTLQFELADLARDKVQDVAEGYREEYVSSEVAERFEDHAEQVIDAKMEATKKEIKQEFTREVADLEQAVNSARNETKNAWKFLQNFADVMADFLEKEGYDDQQQIAEEAKQIAMDAVEEGLEQLATEKGTVDLSGDEREAEQKKQERREARQSATSIEVDSSESSSDESDSLAEDEDDSPEYRLADRALEDQHEELQRMAEEEDLLEMDPGEVAELTDVSEKDLTRNGGILDRMEGKYDTRFGID